MGYIIGIFNRKGGVAKTTSCINIGAIMATMGKKVLLVDGDSQRNLTQFFYRDNPDMFAYDEEIMSEDLIDSIPNLRDVLVGDKTWDEAIKTLTYKATLRDKKTHRFRRVTTSFDVVPTDRFLDYYEGENINSLRDSIQEIKGRYDYILIDFPPAYDVRTVTYLVGCDYVIAPMHLAKESSIMGYKDLLVKCREIIDKWGNRDLKILGAFYTNVMIYKKDQKEMFDMSMEREIREGMRFFRTSIPSGYAAIQRSEEDHRPLIFGQASEKVTVAYKNLVKEIIKRIKEDEKNG